MKTLYDLFKENTRHLKIVEALMPPEEGSPLKKLYTLINSSKKLSDDQCMMIIYGRKNSTAFSRLKFRLKELFLQVIIFQINNNGLSDLRYNEALMVSRNSLLGKALTLRDLNWVSTEILEKSILRAIKYSFTDEILLQSRMLINYYSSPISYNKYKSKKYIEIQNKYLNVYEWEVKSENYFLELQSFQYSSLANVPDELREKALLFCNELGKIRNVDTYRFLYNKYRVFTAYYEYNKDYASILKTSESILKDLSNLESTSVISISAINVRILWAYIQAGRLEDTITVGLESMNKIASGSLAWYRMAHYVLKAYLFSKKYIEAIQFISMIYNHPKFSKLNEYYVELFSAPLGYLHLLKDSEYINYSHETTKILPEFKLGKFLNTTPVFSKDKRGINVSILLLHIAFLLQRKEFSAIIDKIDSLNQYAYRYLRKDDSFRSNCLIKMVIQMTKADFNPIRTDRYTADLRKQLKTVNLAGSGENIEIEILPFEVLWEVMRKSL